MPLPFVVHVRTRPNASAATANVTKRVRRCSKRTNNGEDGVSTAKPAIDAKNTRTLTRNRTARQHQTQHRAQRRQRPPSPTTRRQRQQLVSAARRSTHNARRAVHVKRRCALQRRSQERPNVKQSKRRHVRVKGQPPEGNNAATANVVRRPTRQTSN
jgi:ATPase subunit of ABC transporter with duplicated ATPase domains